MIACPRGAEIRDGWQQPGRDWALSLAMLVGAAVVAIALKPLLDGEVSSGLIFVLGITLIGAYAGLARALVCAVAASAIFNFFLADPVLTFRMSTGEDLAPPVIFTLCAVVSGILSGRLKDQSFRVQQSNLRLQGLLEASRNLQRAATANDVFEALKSSVPATLGVDLALYRLDNGHPVPVGGSRSDPGWLDLAAQSVRESVELTQQGELSGYLLTGSQGTVGVLVNEERDPGLERNFMLALAPVVGLALERAQLASRIAEVQALARTEELKTALLSSVSHDLRTPLTAISASASSLLTFGSQFDAATSQQLLGGIVEECDRLNHLTSNLLEMTRLHGGGATLRRSVLPSAEMIRNSVTRLQRIAGARIVSFIAPAREVYVEADTALFELALTNVLQNAIHYSSPEGIITITCTQTGEHCIITITDNGMGIPAGEQERVFERFYRIERASGSPKGTGLGLAIAKGFVEASNGAIAIHSPVCENRGTQVTIRLPLAQIGAAA